jgi:hypothetical protein
LFASPFPRFIGIAAGDGERQALGLLSQNEHPPARGDDLWASSWAAKIGASAKESESRIRRQELRAGAPFGRALSPRRSVHCNSAVRPQIAAAVAMWAALALVGAVVLRVL